MFLCRFHLMRTHFAKSFSHTVAQRGLDWGLWWKLIESVSALGYRQSLCSEITQMAQAGYTIWPLSDGPVNNGRARRETFRLTSVITVTFLIDSAVDTIS